MFLEVASPISDELQIGQSVAHDGICLTILEVSDSRHRVELIQPTVEKTIARWYQPGQRVNLERSLRPTDRLEGHLVQGHVDTTLQCIDARQEGNTRWLTFRLPAQYAPLVVEEGSIAINGVSLTVARLTDDAFAVALLPHTLQVTNLSDVQPGHWVNVEFDIIGRYLWRFYRLYASR